MLLPARAEVARRLRRYRAWERLMLASPADRAVRTVFEDSGYTLCVLMGERCAREAADAAERYLGAGPLTSLRERQCPAEQGGRPLARGAGRRRRGGGRRPAAGR
ncbi:DUF5133 domain-containing protein [Streptomyces sp. NPDC047000]|uniref:DUF5133 domain-containing protein n=1 Tax=Streptomyces sp. NPDC047000 TaxID=3155474 RepID=UPI0033F69430